nr:MAG TPA: Baseplate wedge protein [Caudoviricetes sp.]
MADKNINSSPEAVTVDKDDYLFLSKDGTNLNKVLISKVLALVDLSTYAPKASPSFSGTPTAPDPISSSNSQQIATTKWVRNLLGNVSTSIPAATSTALGGIKADTADDSYTVEVKIDQATSKLFVPTYPTGAGGTSSYSALSDKPQINNITLAGNKSLSDLGIQPAGNYLTSVPKATPSVYGGIKASEKGAEDTVEVKQDNSSGKLYVPTYPSLSGYALLNAPTFSNPKTNAPAPSSNDTSIPNTQWVRTLVDNKLIPVGGLAGQALVKKSGSDYDVEWATISGGSGGTTNYNALSNRPSINDVILEGSMTAADLGIYSVPTGGTTGQALVKNSNDDHDYVWKTIGSSGGDVDLTEYAKLSSPAFTGTPTAPTQNTTDNSTKIATTAYVKNNLGNYAPITSPSLKGTPTSVTPVSSASGNQIANVTWVRNYGVAKDQGSSNSGKYLSVGSDGMVTLVEAPSGGGSGTGGGSSGGGEWKSLTINCGDGAVQWSEDIDHADEITIEATGVMGEPGVSDAGTWYFQINGQNMIRMSLQPSTGSDNAYQRAYAFFDGGKWNVFRSQSSVNSNSTIYEYVETPQKTEALNSAAISVGVMSSDSAHFIGSGTVVIRYRKSSGGSTQEPRVQMQNTDTSVTIEPGKLYVWPEMSSLSVSFATPSNTGVANEYHFFFKSGATPTTFSMTGVTADAYSIDANTTYEVSVLEGIAYVRGTADA